MCALILPWLAFFLVATMFLISASRCDWKSDACCCCVIFMMILTGMSNTSWILSPARTHCQHYTSLDTCLSAFEAPLDPRTALGGISGNNYSEASAFVVTYPVNNAIDEAGNGNGKALAWSKAFIQLVKEELLPMVQS